MQVRELEDFKAVLAQRLQQQSDDAEFSQLQVEMGKLLVRRTQLQAVHLEREKDQLRRALEEAQSQLHNVQRSFGGLANGLVPRLGRGDLRPRALVSRNAQRGGSEPQQQPPTPDAAGRGGATHAEFYLPRADLSPSTAPSAADARDALSPEAAGDRTAASAPETAGAPLATAEGGASQRPGTSMRNVRDVRMAALKMSPFSVYVGLSRHEERELRQQRRADASGRQWARPRSEGEWGEQRPQRAQFRPIEPPLRPAQVLSIDALRARMLADADALRASWDSELSAPGLAHQLMQSRPRNRGAAFRAMAADELIPTEANPGGGTLQVPTWPPLQRLVEPYIDGQQHHARSRAAARAAQRPVSRSSRSTAALSLAHPAPRPSTQGARLRTVPAPSAVVPMPLTRWQLPRRSLVPALLAAPVADEVARARGFAGRKLSRKSDALAPHPDRAFDGPSPRHLDFALEPVPPDGIEYA
ncbi:hypothetical protein KFE25_010173 [Diacronema lutheri]|uniref:Uncharacterized protein n=1 Tax=Diacronema lutheri TaxID=2081491 RepID=A0A8J5XKQ7_DIALT|nr:hypothetical protein KFE25_010173 [Diacronema lutheri]